MDKINFVILSVAPAGGGKAGRGFTDKVRLRADFALTLNELGATISV